MKGALSEVLGAYSSEHREGMNPRVPSPAHARVQHLNQAREWGICEIKSEMHQVAFASQLQAYQKPKCMLSESSKNGPCTSVLCGQLIIHLLQGDMFSREQLSFLNCNKMWSQGIHERLAYLQLCIGPERNKAPSPPAMKACSAPPALCLGCSFHWLCFSSTSPFFLAGSPHLCLLNLAHS